MVATRATFIASCLTLLKAHLVAQVTDPNSTARDSSRPFVRDGRAEEIPRESGILPLINFFPVSGTATRRGIGTHQDRKQERFQIDIWDDSESGGAAVADDVVDALTVNLNTGTTGLETNGLTVTNVFGPRMLVEAGEPTIYHYIVEPIVKLIGV